MCKNETETKYCLRNIYEMDDDFERFDLNMIKRI